MPDQIAQDNSHCTIRDLSLKMAILLAYFCPGDSALSGKYKNLSNIIQENANKWKEATPENKLPLRSLLISKATIKGWSRLEVKSCDRNKVHNFALFLDIDENSFKNDTANTFFEKFITKKVTIKHIFKKFRHIKHSDWKKLRGFYLTYYKTPNDTISISLALIVDKITDNIPFRFCCIFDKAPQEYRGHWAFEKGAFYAFFDGPEQDGLSTIIAKLPSPNAIASPFLGILLSRNMKGSDRTPFATKILFVPLIVGTDLEKHLANENETYEKIWERLKEDVPEVIAYSRLELKTGEDLYKIVKNEFSELIIVQHEISMQIEEICNKTILDKEL